jgi:hypothetical protein
VRQFLLGMLTAILLMMAAAAWVWTYQPERLPKEWRRANVNSQDYMPTLYRWHDAQGNLQITDRPPPDRPWEAVKIDPNRNLVPAGQLPKPVDP